MSKPSLINSKGINVKNQIQWLALVMVLIGGVAGSLGCATVAATEAADAVIGTNHYFKPILSDEIVAIGKPDAELAKDLGQNNVVAFIGIKNTYLLYKGGEELEHISQLKLEGKRMEMDAVRSNRLYLKDKQVWGELVLTYGGGKPVAPEELAELEKGGFTPLRAANSTLYQKKIGIEGVIYPAIKLSDEQVSKLGMHRAFNLYNPRDSKPPVIGKILKVPLVAVGVAADIALVPVYLGIGAIVIVGLAVSQ